MKTVCFAAAFALLSAGPVFAHPNPKADTQAGNPDKIVCKRLEETGSLVRKPRVCKTRATWENESAAARRHVQDIQDAALINSTRPN